MSEQESSMFPSKSQIHYGDENGFFEKMILKIA